MPHLGGRHSSSLSSRPVQIASGHQYTWALVAAISGERSPESLDSMVVVVLPHSLMPLLVPMPLVQEQAHALAPVEDNLAQLVAPILTQQLLLLDFQQALEVSDLP